MIHGEYEAKKDGFLPGGASLHSMMSPHGPDAKTFAAASAEDLKTVRVADNTQAFMFESSLMMSIASWAVACPERQMDYGQQAWLGLQKHFDPAFKAPK